MRALASRAQSKHQLFHEALFAGENEMTKDELLRIATEVGLDAERLEADMAKPEWQTVIDRNRALAKELGITGTPGFIAGNELQPGPLDLNGLKDLVARARKGKVTAVVAVVGNETNGFKHVQFIFRQICRS